MCIAALLGWEERHEVVPHMLFCALSFHLLCYYSLTHLRIFFFVSHVPAHPPLSDSFPFRPPSDGTLISIGYDNVAVSPLPMSWNLPALYTIAASQAFIACISSVLLLHFALDSWNPDSTFASLGLDGLTYGQVTTMMYFKVSVSDFLTLFSARTPDGPFYSVAPSRILLVAGMFATCVSTLLASVWPDGHPDGIATIGLAREKPRIMPLYVWIYCFVMWLAEDAFKVLVIYTLKSNNIFSINDTAHTRIAASHGNLLGHNTRKSAQLV